MARTKQSARKNASPCTPPSSSSSYQSRERSPSPPPRPSPPHTSSASPSSQNSQEVLNLIPLSTFLPPLYIRPTPNYAQVPPHLRTRITPPRRSMPVQSSIGTSKSMNPKPFYFIISDSKSDDSSDSCPPVAKSPTQTEPQRNTMPTVPTPPPQNPPTTTNPSTPSKSAFSSEPSHHPKRSSPISTSSDSEPSPPTKKPKQNAPPLISLAKSKLFNEKWAQRPIGIGRIFVFDNLVVDGNDVQHHTNGVEIRLTPDILANILQLPTEGPSVFGDNWYSALGLRKTDVLAELFEENSTRYLATYLKPLPNVFNNMCQHTLLPHCGNHEYVSDNDVLLIYHLLNCKRLNLPHVILQHMICAAQKDYKKNIVPYGMKTSSSIFGISQFLNFPATADHSTSSLGPIPSISSSFASLTSLYAMPIPSNTVVATSSQPSVHLPSTNTLVAPSNSDIMAALQIIMFCLF
uniref:Uncharacterized protein LOC101514524 n=1 Tax=Cicer arietinum TaxID=3827 RepID=A0A1S2XIC9_CICAR|nr:uncharacterized protein LOC101514524 [Cicer arietinum]